MWEVEKLGLEAIPEFTVKTLSKINVLEKNRYQVGELSLWSEIKIPFCLWLVS